jgi:iron complex outermembrane receptor protein
MKIFSLVLLTILFSAVTFAQSAGSVSGTISNADGKGAGGAQVTLTLKNNAGVTFSTSSDSGGKYGFENIPAGTYLIGVTGTGSADGTRASETIELAAGQNRALDLTLLPVITAQVSIAAGTSQPLEAVSKSIDIIDAQEMRDRADFSLADSLRTVPGFRVQQLGGFGRLASVKTRGLRNQDTAILIDGIRFRDVTAITGDASSFLGDFTLTSVSRIEVLRGSGSSLYGTNAVGGTIDFETPKPPPGFHGQMSGAMGGLGLKRFRGNVSDGTKDGKLGFNLGVSRTVYTEGVDGDDDAHNTNFQNRIEYNPFSRTNLSARFFVSDGFVRLNTSPNTIGTLPVSSAQPVDAIPLSPAELKRYENGTPTGSLNIGNATFIPDADDPDNFQKSQFFSGQFAFNQVINDKFSFQSYYQGLKTTRKVTNGPRGVGFQVLSGADETDSFDGQVHTINGHFNWMPNRVSQTTFGYEFEWEKYAGKHITIDLPSNSTVDAKQSSHTVYLQELLNFMDGRLQLSGAFRAQYFSVSQPVFVPATNPIYQNLPAYKPETAFTGDGSAAYFFRSTNTKIRAHVGNGYREPSLYERFGSSYFFGSYSNSGDPNLKPERSVAWDAGVDQTFYKDRVRLSANYFYTDIQKSIDYAFCVPQCLPGPDPLSRFGGYYNTEGRIARGFEAIADIKPFRSTRIFTSYTFTNSDERNPYNLQILTSPGIPTHLFSLAATQRLGKRATINFDLAATSAYLFPFYNFNFVTFEEKYYMYRFKGSVRGDLTGNFEIPTGNEKMHLVLFGTIENIFDSDNFENGFRTPGITGRGGVRVSF